MLQFMTLFAFKLANYLNHNLTHFRLFYIESFIPALFQKL